MSYWVLGIAEGGVSPALRKQEHWRELISRGLDYFSMRQVLDGIFAEGPIECRLFVGESDYCTTRQISVPDHMILGVIPVFSERALLLAQAEGCEAKDWRTCEFETNPGELFYLHLPIRLWDVLDHSRSRFRHQISVEPPIPYFCESAHIFDSSGELPGVFRVPVPDQSQAVGELFVSGRFKERWVENGFSGATFREV